MSTSENQAPPRIHVWVCPECGYWRADRHTGIHTTIRAASHAHEPITKRLKIHRLVEAAYIYDGETE